MADNCFGDYYTRTGLSYAQREMITFCFLAAQGGCETQLTSHAAGNMKVGNDKVLAGNNFFRLVNNTHPNPKKIWIWMSISFMVMFLV